MCVTGLVCCTVEINRHCKPIIMEKIKIIKKKNNPTHWTLYHVPLKFTHPLIKDDNDSECFQC